MRRKDRSIPHAEAIELLQKAEVGYLSLAVDNTPYVVPLNFVVMDNNIYFHAATTGRKLDMLDQNPKCCFLVSSLDGIKAGTDACDFGAFFKSAIVEGTARRVTDVNEMITSLNKLTEKHNPAGHSFREVTPEQAKSVAVIAISIDSICGKARKQ